MMKRSTKNKTKGRLHEMKGKVKVAVGKATNNRRLVASGRAEKTSGKVQGWIGRAQRTVGK
ncbi:MAG TPA: CsbD family protein [Verrucomicrobiae bacterium]|nr:CsbD family protein [Verrucomicrobiae bacterium]